MVIRRFSEFSGLKSGRFWLIGVEIGGVMV